MFVPLRNSRLGMLCGNCASPSVFRWCPCRSERPSARTSPSRPLCLSELLTVQLHKKDGKPSN
eukprot:4416341-Pyramimonas_sp.AAC.1